MFSNFEAVKYGIQMLVIPFVSDQFRNGLLIESQGYGKCMDFKDITPESFQRTISEMLSSKKYSRRAKEVSAIFKDNPMAHPMDEFVWWIDHVIKTRGAKYLKSHATDMSLFTYLLVDVALANLILILTVTFAIYFAIKKLCCKLKSVVKRTKKKKQ